MLPSIARRRIMGLARARDGLAAVEFALVLPMLGLLFFGMLEGSDLLTVNRKLANSANALADLVSQEPQITWAQVESITVGVERMLEPTDTSGLTLKVVSIIQDPGNASRAIVHWSRDRDGGTPYSAGSQYNRLGDNAVVNAVASLIVVEVEYTYQSDLTQHVFTMPYEFVREAKRFPRKSARVQLCNNATPAVCTT